MIARIVLRDYQEAALDAIRTKGEAADRITQFMAEQAIQVYDAEIAPVADGQAA